MAQDSREQTSWYPSYLKALELEPNLTTEAWLQQNLEEYTQSRCDTNSALYDSAVALGYTAASLDGPTFYTYAPPAALAHRDILEAQALRELVQNIPLQQPASLAAPSLGAESVGQDATTVVPAVPTMVTDNGDADGGYNTGPLGVAPVHE